MMTFMAMMICTVTLTTQYWAAEAAEDPVIWNGATWPHHKEWKYPGGRIVTFADGSEVCTRP